MTSQNTKNPLGYSWTNIPGTARAAKERQIALKTRSQRLENLLSVVDSEFFESLTEYRMWRTRVIQAKIDIFKEESFIGLWLAMEACTMHA